MEAGMRDPSSIRSILVVDDHPLVRDTLARGFRLMRIEVDCAVDCEDALARAKARRPDLAIVDLLLSSRSGFEVVKALHDLDPAMVLSGWMNCLCRRRGITCLTDCWKSCGNWRARTAQA
jgi:ActR/RegA family two-component response regulator